MYPRNGIVIRPLIDVTRREILEFLGERSLACLHDRTNDDISIPRNRVRLELLPLLAARFNPQIADVLDGEAELARADDQLLDEQAAAWYAEHVVEIGPCQRRIDMAALVSAPKAIAWRALRQTMSLTPKRFIGVQHIRRVWDVVLGDAGPFDAPGQRVERVGGWIVLTGRPPGSVGRPAAAPNGQTVPFECRLPVPGEVTLPDGGPTVSAELGFRADEVDSGDRFVAVVPKEKVASGLVVRSRRPGDRLKPSDAGHRKLQDLLVDRKVPRTERDRVPIVVDMLDRIVWVAGHVVDRDFRVSDPAQAVVILRLKGVGGSF
jgi:tRNA(Ile)-lysidine synthase